MRYPGLEGRDWVKRYRATAGAPGTTPPSTASRPCRSQALQAHKHRPVEAVTVTSFESREGCGVAPRGPRYRTSMTATPPARSSRQAACTRARTPTAETSGQRSQPPPHSAPPRPAAWTSASVRLRTDHGRAADAYGPSQGGRFHRRNCAPGKKMILHTDVTAVSPPVNSTQQVQPASTARAHQNLGTRTPGGATGLSDIVVTHAHTHPRTHASRAAVWLL